jgi:hypothetical protein
MNTFETYLNRIENQDLKEFTKYLDAHEYSMLEMHFLSFAKEQLRIHDVVGRSEQLKAFSEMVAKDDLAYLKDAETLLNDFESL